MLEFLFREIYDYRGWLVSFFARLKQGLSKTRHQLGAGISRLLLGKKEIDSHVLDNIETLLIQADVGIETTQKLIQQITDGLARKVLIDGDAVLHALKAHLLSLLEKLAEPIPEGTQKPRVILMVGVNGAGKTTTIGKLAQQYQKMGKKVMLAAGDTFRAAAVEQLQVWGARNHVPVVAQQTGADSASVIYDAYISARSRGIDILLADTAGRLHTQYHLMAELQKIKRVLQKIDATAPHETMLVLDASIGHNAFQQAQQFHAAMGVTGLIMTKLDGTAKGGIVFRIADILKIPLRYIGVGEGIDDLRPFHPQEFIDALFDDEK